jgi:hypothetical protein
MLATIWLAAPWPAHSFAIAVTNPSVLNPDGSIDELGSLEAAIRWSAVEDQSGVGLPGGLTVGVQPGFAGGLGASTPAEIADYRDALIAAFRLWETDVITFDIEFDHDGLGKEITVGLANSSHPFFMVGPGIPGAVGFTISEFDSNRTLTNGEVLPGLSSTHGFVLMNTDLLNTDITGFTHPRAIFDFRWLMVHEVGHVLGLGHPFEDLNFDDDDDASTPLAIDPSDPLARLSLSAEFNPDAIMVVLGQGNPGGGMLPPGLSLHWDDIAGIDVLYPVPDTDGDSVLDLNDNCTTSSNPAQIDTDADSFGNACDCDFDGDGTCGIGDFNVFLADFQAQTDGGTGTDMDGNGSVGIQDFNLFLPGFQAGAPGPSGLVP